MVAEMLAELAGPAEPGELAGEAAARFSFASSASPVRASPASRPAWQRPWLSAPRAGVAAGLVAAAVGLGGGAAAAYAGALPGPIQDFAHHMIGAPPHGANLVKPQPGKPGKSKAHNDRAAGPKTHATPRHVTPGEGRTHGKTLPPPAKGHARPSTPPGKAAPPKPKPPKPNPSSRAKP